MNPAHWNTKTLNVGLGLKTNTDKFLLHQNIVENGCFPLYFATIDTEVQTHCPDTATARRAILYCIYHIAKKHSHKITNRRQDDDGIQPIIKVKAG